MNMESTPPGYIAAAQLDRSSDALSRRSTSPSALTPPSSIPDTNHPGRQSSEKKKRKSWGQEIPDIPRTLGPRKRAKTDQERQQRNIERIERNRHSAAKSREKQKAEAAELRKQNEEQKEYIARLEERLRQYEGGSAPSSMPSIPTPTSDQFSNDFELKVEHEPSEFADDRSSYSFYPTPTPQPMSRTASTISSTISASTLAPTLKISQADRAPSVQGFRNSATSQVEPHGSLGRTHNVSMTKFEGAPHVFDATPKTVPTPIPSLLDVPSGSQHSAAVFSTIDQQCPLGTSSRWAGRPTSNQHTTTCLSILICFQTLLMALTSQVSTKTISTVRMMFSQAERQLVSFSPTSRDQILILMLSLITTPTATAHQTTSATTTPKTTTTTSSHPSVFRGRLLRKLVAWSPISAHLLKVAAGRASRRMVSDGSLLDTDNPTQLREWASLMTFSWALHRSLAAMGHATPHIRSGTFDQQDDDDMLFSEGLRREWISLQQRQQAAAGMYQYAWGSRSGSGDGSGSGSALHAKFATLKGAELWNSP